MAAWQWQGSATHITLNKWWQSHFGNAENRTQKILCYLAAVVISCWVLSYVWVFLTFWHYAGEDHFVLPPFLDVPKHYYSQHHVGHWGRVKILNIIHGSENSYTRAQQYYQEQLPEFKKAAARFKLHPAFVGVPDIPIDPTFYDMVTVRLKHLLANYKKYKWDDWKIEKNKCTAVSFLANNSFPHSEALGVWESAPLLLEMLPKVLAKNTDWPLWLKNCHLTAGADNSVWNPPIASLQDFENRKSELTEWVKAKWIHRSNDYERPWSQYANPLMSTLSPGFILQKPASFDMEIKTEVIWGRAYMLMVDGLSSAILRNGEIQYYEPGSWRGDWLNQASHSKELEWIVREGHHLRCIELAEKFARIAAIDEIRVDVFIKKGNAMAAMVNEDSISSGGQYRSHFSHMAEVWAMGHREKLYQIKDTDVPAYAGATDIAYSIPMYGGSPKKHSMSGRLPDNATPYPNSKKQDKFHD